MPEPERMATPAEVAPHPATGNGVAPLLKDKAGKKGKGEKPERGVREDRGRADRSAENLLRIVHMKHEQLSAMADNKAHIMLTISVGVIGVGATQLFDPQLQYAAIVLIISALAAAGLAVLATMPTLPKNRTVDLSDPSFNIVFFSDFARLPYDVYEREMERVLAEKRLTNQALIKDLHSLGRVLNGRKFRLLGLCYRVFLGGLVAAVLVLAVTIIALWS